MDQMKHQKQYNGKMEVIVEMRDVHASNLPITVPMMQDFNNNQLLGKAKCFMRDGKMMAELSFHDKVVNGFPAIGGRVIEREGNVITKFDLFAVGICSGENVDPNIKSIFEQCGKSE